MSHSRLFCSFLLVSWMAFSTISQAETWQAGTAKAMITPEQPMWMAGYAARTAPADGKLTELWAKALILEDGDGDRGVILTLDLVGIDRQLSEAICDSLQQRHGLERNQIVICASHTHCGPVVGMNLGPLHYLRLPPAQQKLVDDYTEKLHATLVDVVGEALTNLAPCELSWGVGQSTFAVNRRENTPYGDVAQRRSEGALQGPVDHDVPVLAVHDADEKLKAVLFGYACHATTLSLNQWSGDYPGYAQQELEARFPDCMALFWAGCGADQNPLPRRTVDLAEHYGRRLATAVEAVLLTSAMKPIEGELEMTYAEIDLPFGPLPTADEIERDTKSDNVYTVARAKLLTEKLADGPLSQTYPYPISCWSIGTKVDWVALGGEVVVDYALRLKTELGAEPTWVAGYSHDVMAYIPSRRVLREGGYEGGGSMVYYGLPTVWAPTIENMIASEVNRQVDATEPATVE